MPLLPGVARVCSGVHGPRARGVQSPGAAAHRATITVLAGRCSLSTHCTPRRGAARAKGSFLGTESLRRCFGGLDSLYKDGITTQMVQACEPPRRGGAGWSIVLGCAPAALGRELGFHSKMNKNELRDEHELDCGRVNGEVVDLFVRLLVVQEVNTRTDLTATSLLIRSMKHAF